MLLTLLFACTTRQVEPELYRLGYHFFSLHISTFSIYDVGETTHALIPAPATVKYQVKEVIAAIFTDLAQEKAYLINHFSRLTDAGNGQLYSVWTAELTLNGAVRTENSISFLKMVFPIAANTTWNGNVLNNLDEEIYRFKAVNKPFEVSGKIFEHTVPVIQGRRHHSQFNKPEQTV